MRFRLILVAAIAVLSSLLLTPSANAAAVTTSSPFFKRFDAGDGCTHEPGLLSGTVRFTFFEDDGIIVASSSHPNTTYTTDSGSIYRFIGGSTNHTISPDGFPQTIVSNSTFNLVGADGQFHGHGIFVFTINANGDITASVESITFDCGL